MNFINNIRKYIKGDLIIWIVLLFLFIFSILIVYSSSSSLAYRYQNGNTLYYFLKHTSILVIGLLIIYFLHKVPYIVFSKLSFILLVISIVLLIFTLALGLSVNQAARWLKIPGLGITFQTSDLAKLSLILYVSRVLSIHQNEIKDFKKVFLPLLIIVGFTCLLIFPANFSTSALLFITCMLLMFIGRIPFKYIFFTLTIALMLFGIFLSLSFAFKWEGRWETWRNRIKNFVVPSEKENYEENYHVIQAKIAIVNGGIIKLRPGKSVQKNFLPNSFNDSIFPIIIEEYGFIGGAFIMFLYLFLLFRAGVILRKSDRAFPALVAIGLTLLIVIQAFINMAVAVNILPVTGQPLPFISMGGTSILFTSIAFGIILSVSRSIEEKSDKINTEKEENYNEENDEEQ